MALLILGIFLVSGISGCAQQESKEPLINVSEQGICTSEPAIIDNRDLLPSDSNNYIESETNKIYLTFYETEYKCPMNGKIYVDDTLLGETKKGEYELSEEEYKDKFKEDSSLYIQGLTDSCFGEDMGLPLVWDWIVPDLQYNFDYNENASFEASINPRNPQYYSAMQGFIRPSETEDYLNSKLKEYFVNSTIEDLDIITQHRIMSYRSDMDNFQQREYWQTPAETLKRGMGDCEDWAVTILSLMRAYDSSIRCFNALWQTHISIFCFFDNHFIIYDQGGTKRQIVLYADSAKQDNQVTIRNMRNNYFEEYGISPNERKLDAIFNEEELIIFEEDEDFVNWVISQIE